jgi:hypothetical protein
LFDVEIRTSGPELAAQKLKKALQTKGITITNDRLMFQIVVPEEQVTATRQLVAELRTPSDPRPSGLFPGGAIINLPDSDLSEVIGLYSKITGRSLDQRQPLPSLSAKVSFTTQTPLDDKECVHAFEMLLGLQGLRIVPGEKNTFRVISVSDRAGL